MIDHQFYPTPPSLALKMVAKFKSQNVVGLLDPSGGRGDLLDVAKNAVAKNAHALRRDEEEAPDLYLPEPDAWRNRYGRSTFLQFKKTAPVHAVEIDLQNQAILRSKGYKVVGIDWMAYQGATIYSHIIMNPPFNAGVAHVLRAWNLLQGGELVALVNAANLKNPTRQAESLLKLIQDHGSVEYIQEAFMTPDTGRTTRVEVALIHLEKAPLSKMAFLDALKKEVRPAPCSVEAPQDLVIPESWIDNLVIAFECATKAAQQATLCNVRANYYASMLGRAIHSSDESDPAHNLFGAASFNETYDDLKARAWSSILRSTDVLKLLSSAAQRRVESEFESIKALEFTKSNIYGFLAGLAFQQGEIQIGMLCDVFDLFSKYHPENRVYYQGWKSNAKHRCNAFRLMTTRMVLPACRRDWYSSTTRYLAWEDNTRFADIDKVFAMLDGKAPSDTSVRGLVSVFDDKDSPVYKDERVASDYFDVRLYRKAGTFHLYPRRKDLIDRLNRLVGKHRAWLPVDETDAPPAFWEQFDRAEAINKRMSLGKDFSEWRLAHGSEGEKAKAAATLESAHQAAMKSLGIEFDPSTALCQDPEQLALGHSVA